MVGKCVNLEKTVHEGAAEVAARATLVTGLLAIGKISIGLFKQSNP